MHNQQWVPKWKIVRFQFPLDTQLLIKKFIHSLPRFNRLGIGSTADDYSSFSSKWLVVVINFVLNSFPGRIHCRGQCSLLIMNGWPWHTTRPCWWDNETGRRWSATLWHGSSHCSMITILYHKCNFDEWVSAHAPRACMGSFAFTPDYSWYNTRLFLNYAWCKIGPIIPKMMRA